MTDAWIKVLILAAGGAVGVNARYWQSAWMGRWVGPHFPWATFAINVAGSFLIGLASAILATRLEGHAPARLAVVVGFLGGYTTFSSYALEGVELLERGRPRAATAYLGGSVLSGVGAAAAGLALGRSLASRL